MNSLTYQKIENVVDNFFEASILLEDYEARRAMIEMGYTQEEADNISFSYDSDENARNFFGAMDNYCKGRIMISDERLFEIAEEMYPSALAVLRMKQEEDERELNDFEY